MRLNPAVYMLTQAAPYPLTPLTTGYTDETLI